VKQLKFSARLQIHVAVICVGNGARLAFWIQWLSGAMWYVIVSRVLGGLRTATTASTDTKATSGRNSAASSQASERTDRGIQMRPCGGALQPALRSSGSRALTCSRSSVPPHSERSDARSAYVEISTQEQLSAWGSAKPDSWALRIIFGPCDFVFRGSLTEQPNVHYSPPVSVVSSGVPRTARLSSGGINTNR